MDIPDRKTLLLHMHNEIQDHAILYLKMISSAFKGGVHGSAHVHDHPEGNT